MGSAGLKLLAIVCFAFLVAHLPATARAGVTRVATEGCPPPPPPVTVRRITRPRWLTGTVVTEYFPVPEAWFAGRTVRAPGLAGRHRVDWLYGPAGLAMNGDGVGLDGRVYHFAGPYDLGWVNQGGAPTIPCWNGSWSQGRPAWLDLGWRNAHRAVTFPLANGSWSNGRPASVTPPRAEPRFERGSSLPLAYWKRVAVDPRLIPLGSRIFISAYCDTPARGWFVAGDTGGAIIARHVDVFRRPPPSLADTRALRGQAIFVVPPQTHPHRTPACEHP